MSRVYGMRLHLACLAFASMPLAAGASPLTQDDAQALAKVFGLDRMIDGAVDLAISRQSDLSATQLACARPIVVASFSALVEGSVRDSIPTHEVAAEWLRFAGTRGGTILLGALRDGIDAVLHGRTPPKLEEVRSRMSESEAAEVSAFVASPAGSAGIPKVREMSPEMEKAMVGKLLSECAVNVQ